ncbi:MAG: hypothetical protein V4628_07400 [Pseudomonadota bacterium]
MSWNKWAPLRYIIRKAAQKQGFLDPIELLARLRSFAQPSEVGEPIELLRAGVVFHARGLINSKVIQYNLDWVWPYWIEKQYHPKSDSFIPRAFSASHINLTHRNWTAIGYPDSEQLPLVDPRGLVTPLYDGWSIDVWIVTHDGRYLLPSQTDNCTQTLHTENGMCISTRTSAGELSLTSTSQVELRMPSTECVIQLQAQADAAGWVVVSLRPYNPEGISFIDKVKLLDNRKGWLVEDKDTVEFSLAAEHHQISDYDTGDVFLNLNAFAEKSAGECKAGMLTAAAFFPLNAANQLDMTVRIPLPSTPTEKLQPNTWMDIKEQVCKLSCPDPQYQFLFDAAVSSLVLHSPYDVYPGPYTYKRFWFRDAAFMIQSLLCLGMNDRARRAISRFAERQTTLGYFRSQEGEWDANGEVLWILRRFEELTGTKLPPEWHTPIKRGAQWICRKRLPETPDSPHAGLLPPGFSAEHLGPNDYYYWDDFWCIKGLEVAAEMIEETDATAAESYRKVATQFSAAVERSLATCRKRLKRMAMPAAPYRRLDAGAIGSLAVGYPLQACAPDDPGLLDLVEFLLQDCFVDDAFFQDMIHSGLNAYLTLHVAQVLLRAGDPRYLELMDAVAVLASSTGQWPEAIHPRTLGGCMGDGHHVWAAAEWVMMIRNCFVREEKDRLIIGAGIPGRWLEHESHITFGPAPTSFGVVSITIVPDSKDQVVIFWKGDWKLNSPIIEVKLPGFKHVSPEPGITSLILVREESVPA